MDVGGQKTRTVMGKFNFNINSGIVRKTNLNFDGPLDSGHDLAEIHFLISRSSMIEVKPCDLEIFSKKNDLNWSKYH